MIPLVLGNPHQETPISRLGVQALRTALPRSTYRGHDPCIPKPRLGLGFRVTKPNTTGPYIEAKGSKTLNFMFKPTRVYPKFYALQALSKQMDSGLTYLWLARNEGRDPDSSPYIAPQIISSFHIVFCFFVHY